MLTHQFLTKKYIVGFLKWLDDHIKLEKLNYDSLNNEYIQRSLLSIPIQFGVHDKFYSIVNSSSARKTFPPEASIAPVDIQNIFPRIGVSLQGFAYDIARHINKNNREYDKAGSVTIAPVPYNLELEVTTKTKLLDDTLQILETIVPYFSPTLSIDLKIFGESESTTIGINTVSFDWPVDMAETDERIFTTNFYFTIRANYYLQKKLEGNRIENISVNFNDEIDKLWEKYTVIANHPLPTDYPDTPKDQIPITETISNNID